MCRDETSLPSRPPIEVLQLFRRIDWMAEAGIVGDYNGSQACEVVMTLEHWEAMRSSMEAELQKNYEADQMTDDSSRTPWDDEDEVPSLTDDRDIQG